MTTAAIAETSPPAFEAARAPRRLDAAEFSAMLDNIREATAMLKTLGHDGRMMILCHLAAGEKSVTELEELLSSRQSAVSQQLARLRQEGLVEYRRVGKAIFYRLEDERVRRMIEAIYDLFCGEVSAGPK